MWVHTNTAAMLTVTFVNRVKSIKVLFNTVTSGQNKVLKPQALAQVTYFCNAFNKYVVSCRTSAQRETSSTLLFQQHKMPSFVYLLGSQNLK